MVAKELVVFFLSLTIVLIVTVHFSRISTAPEPGWILIADTGRHRKRLLLSVIIIEAAPWVD